MDLTNLLSQTLDGKYLIESELGRGGMGTVFLATHVGTERPVAVKVISPQFMRRPEFVERFRREARAAGRLRHPNVVDVTDFGFTETQEGRVAYLVMEYLDGCTLGEILEEEKNLPVGWTLDILEQVCSAVQEAHNQGIIHRDLKPDNIWLEPNQRGGYTVKVLDFGIAKLEAVQVVDTGEHEIRQSAVPTFAGSPGQTLVDGVNDTTIHDSISPTMLAEAATMAGLPHSADTPESGSEAQTAIMGNGDPQIDQESVGTRLMSLGDDTDRTNVETTSDLLDDELLATKDLTKVGAVLGTPLYMSPEQCSGYRLDARSDVYSIGVIAYQMLSGDTPFKGDFSKVMEAHKVLPPPPLAAKKVRKKLKRVINSALSKQADARPQTAEAFASELRSRSEGIFGLLRRAGMIWTEHLPKFIMLSAFFHLPMVFFTGILIVISFLKVSGYLDETLSNIGLGITGAVLYMITLFCAYLIVGTITWIVTQSMAIPLRPIRLRSALKEARSKWKTFAGTGILSFVLQIGIMIITCGIGFLVTSVLWTLLAPVVMMENLKGMQALRRSTKLVRRSLATSVAAVALMFLIPFVCAGAISFVISISAKALTNETGNARTADTGNPAAEPAAPVEGDQGDQKDAVDINIGNNRAARIIKPDKGMRDRVKDTALEILLQVVLLPLQIIITSFTAIIVALLYLKTRQAGGESLQDLLAKFEETDQPRKKWQERVRQRLIQSGRLTTATTSKP
ncbi:MAG TPA: serine/threonine-protein kinase [Pyrinomonadaceae bacterium]|nr:serine/threonine-protein kinase [Pyrinomonadaceae bacterium]